MNSQEIVLRTRDGFISVDGPLTISPLEDATIFKCEFTGEKNEYYLRLIAPMTCETSTPMSLDIWDEYDPELMLYKQNDSDNQKFNILASTMQIFDNSGSELLFRKETIFIQFVARLRLLSFNIQECLNSQFGALSWGAKGIVHEFKKYESGADIVSFIDKTKPHMICLQEFSENPGCDALDTLDSCRADAGWRAQLQNPIIVDKLEVKHTGSSSVKLSDDRCYSYVGISMPVVGNVLVVNIHITYKKISQAENITQLMGFINRQLQSGTHIILAGDFNFKSTSPQFKRITERLIPLTNNHIDHIFASTGLVDAFKVTTCHVHSSDHDPTLVEMRWVGSKKRFKKSVDRGFDVW